MPRGVPATKAAEDPDVKKTIEHLICTLAERAEARAASDEYKLHESIARLYEAIKD